MKRYRVTLRVYQRADVLRGVELPEGLAVRAANFVLANVGRVTDEFVELLCVENIEESR